MRKGFWEKLQKPFFVLAPMYEVTDNAFREMLARHARPDVFFTEFVSADGLIHEASREKLIALHLRYEQNQRPIVAQIFSSNPSAIYEATKLIESLGFDGVDINMGCPDKTIVKQGSGSALIQDPGRAKEIVSAAQEGAKTIPISVKTRTGFSSESVDSWIGALLETKPAAITVHGRTRKEMSRVPADWNAIGQAARIAKGSETLIIGNGDVRNTVEGEEKSKLYGVDGVMIGRAIFENFYVFSGRKQPSLEERMQLLREHVELFEGYYKDLKPFRVMYKHIGNYLKGFKGAKNLRSIFMQSNSAGDFFRTLQKISTSKTISQEKQEV